MKEPTREEVIDYAESMGIAGTPAVTYWAHGVETSWTMRDGAKVDNWKACFRLWMERMQGRPGFEIAENNEVKMSIVMTNAEAEKQQMRKDGDTFHIVKSGREAGASDDRIMAALRGRGLEWPDYADVRYQRPDTTRTP